MSEALEKVYKVIDDVTDPKLMSKEEYRDFLGELISDLEGRRFRHGVETHGKKKKRPKKKRPKERKHRG